MFVFRKIVLVFRSSLPPTLVLIFVTVIASLALVVVAPSAAHADDSQSFSGAPADGEGPDTTRTRFTFSADPGQTISDAYYIENSGTLPQDVSIYSTDAFNAEDGAFSLLDGTLPAAGVGAWVSFEGSPRQIITVAPGASKVIPFVISIPADASPGDHVGGIIVSVISPDGQVKLERRVATRLYLRVSGELQPGLTVSGLSSVYQPDLNPFNGKMILTYTVKNTGNVALSARSVSSVSGLFGMALSGQVTSNIPELLPDGSHAVTTEVPGVWQWLWSNAKFGLIGTVDAGVPSPGIMPTANREASTWAVPWALLVALMLGGFVVLYIRFSRMNNERRSQQWIDFTEAEARLRAREESPES
ncbi:MAG: dihydroorotate dehydrogenase (fumarate) [Alpinimonas sp.]|jgi:hypothetical protein